MVIEGWIKGSIELTKKTFTTAAIPISDSVSILRPPGLAAALDLLYHPDCLLITQRILEFARLSHENVIVDVGGGLGPAVGTLMRSADMVVLVVDDSILGLTAALEYLSILLPVLDGQQKLRLLASGTKKKNAAALAAFQSEKNFALPPQVFDLPSIPFEPNAEHWPGIGKTLYSIGGRRTRRAIEQLAEALDLVPEPKTLQIPGSELLASRPRVGTPSGLIWERGLKAS